MYRTPSSIRKKKHDTHLNLVPILDSFLVLMYFLLLSGSLFHFFNLSSNVPIVSNDEPKSDSKPLALTMQVNKDQISLLTGMPGTVHKIINNVNNEYDYEGLRNELIQLKKQWPQENMVILNLSDEDIKYETIVKLMDTAKLLRNTDESIYFNDKDGVSKKVTMLFDNIIFDNLK